MPQPPRLRLFLALEAGVVGLVSLPRVEGPEPPVALHFLLAPSAKCAIHSAQVRVVEPSLPSPASKAGAGEVHAAPPSGEGARSPDSVAQSLAGAVAVERVATCPEWSVLLPVAAGPPL